ncbi:MAD2 mitotic arrest deficient-like 2 [Umbelopsis nana]
MADITAIISEFYIFASRQKYNVPVKMSRHPDINLYINHIVAACKDGIQQVMLPFFEAQGMVKSVAVVIVDGQLNPVERFVFELNSIFQPSPHQYMDSVTTELRLLDLELQLKAFLLRINAAEALLRPLPEDCRFSLVVDMKKPIAPTSTQEAKTGVSPWIPADATQKQENFNGSNLIPLKSFDTGVLQVFEQR